MCLTEIQKLAITLYAYSSNVFQIRTVALPLYTRNGFVSQITYTKTIVCRKCLALRCWYWQSYRTPIEELRSTYKYTGIGTYFRYRQYHYHCILNMAEYPRICQHCYLDRNYCAAVMTLLYMVRSVEALPQPLPRQTEIGKRTKRDHFPLPHTSFFFVNFPASRVYLVGFNEELPRSERKGWYCNQQPFSRLLFFSSRLIQISCSSLFLKIWALRNCIRLEGERGCQGNFPQAPWCPRSHPVGGKVTSCRNVILTVSFAQTEVQTHYSPFLTHHHSKARVLFQKWNTAIIN
jgi:hypothetical protein